MTKETFTKKELGDLWAVLNYQVFNSPIGSVAEEEAVNLQEKIKRIMKQDHS